MSFSANSINCCHFQYHYFLFKQAGVNEYFQIFQLFVNAIEFWQLPNAGLAHKDIYLLSNLYRTNTWGFPLVRTLLDLGACVQSIAQEIQVIGSSVMNLCNRSPSAPSMTNTLRNSWAKIQRNSLLLASDLCCDLALISRIGLIDLGKHIPLLNFFGYAAGSFISAENTINDYNQLSLPISGGINERCAKEEITLTLIKDIALLALSTFSLIVSISFVQYSVYFNLLCSTVSTVAMLAIFVFKQTPQYSSGLA